ncbi:efflux RND transporter periplasmic adaptor subunit [Saccharomonospora halophila]|uniref:efflux RND transporter periplasmic adaptor subunit n=1 Tax=Saccharomonospora halophila TaxID=129922 RepID=UPI0003629A78|nr:efflux RND transporter periplasmic adaptor subunit [Saccharomonospora halophila]
MIDDMGDPEGAGVPDPYPRQAGDPDNAAHPTEVMPVCGILDDETSAQRSGEEADNAEKPPEKRPRKKRWVVLGLVAVLVVGTGAFAAFWAQRDDESSNSRERVPVEAVAVQRGDLSESATLTGNLDYTAKRPLTGSASGIVTELPAVGDTVGRGEQLYRVDDSPVPVFYGDTPLYRTLDTEGMVGRDVRVVANNLATLEYRVGQQPPVGTVLPRPDTPQQDDSSGQQSRSGDSGRSAAPPSGGADTGTSTESSDGSDAEADTVTVREGDAVLTASLIDAIERWQRDVGMPATGVLGLGHVAVLPGEVRVDAVRAQLGDNAEDTVLTVSSTAKAVIVRAPVSDLDAIAEGQEVTVTLPDDTTAPGKVATIEPVTKGGSPGSGSPDGPGESERKVTVTLTDHKKVDGEPGPVQVRFTTKTHEDVLVVPVGALLTLREGGYAVRVPERGLVKVQTGMSVRGKIEITGDGIEPGTKVVTTS